MLVPNIDNRSFDCERRGVLDKLDLSDNILNFLLGNMCDFFKMLIPSTPLEELFANFVYYVSCEVPLLVLEELRAL